MSSKKTKNRNKQTERPNSISGLKAAVEKSDDRERLRFESAEVDRAEKKIASLENNAGRADEPVRRAAAERVEQPDNSDDEEEVVKEFIPRSSHPTELMGITANLSDALNDDEGFDGDDTSESDVEAVEQPLQRPNKLYLLFAIFVIIMSVIGIISTVNFCIDKVSDIANQTELKNEFTVFLYPVVSVDPPDCESVDGLPATIVLESAIWRIILRGENANYERLSKTYMYVPAVDVEYSVRAIYGNAAKIEHQTVGSIDTTFTYVKDLNSYIVPVNPFYTAYTPYVREISSVGELYTVTVDYIIPSALNIEGIEYENPPAKTMNYTLSKRANSMTLHSIKNITTKESMYE